MGAIAAMVPKGTKPLLQFLISICRSAFMPCGCHGRDCGHRARGALLHQSPSSSSKATTVDSTPALTDGSGEILNNGE